MDLAKIQEVVFKEYLKNGFAQSFQKTKPIFMGDLAELGLVTTEVSEAIEAVRDGTKEKIAMECADVVIRIMNFCSRKDIDLQKAILEKNDYNFQREIHHGRKNI